MKKLHLMEIEMVLNFQHTKFPRLFHRRAEALVASV